VLAVGLAKAGARWVKWAAGAAADGAGCGGGGPGRSPPGREL